jgi:hypothetical protein
MGLVSGATSAASVLEVLDFSTQSLKELDLSSALKTPEGFEQSRPGQVVAVAVLQSGREGGRLTAVLDSQGCIRLFETDDGALEVSKRNWAEIMGAGDRKSEDYGGLHGHKPEEGTSKPRFGVDKPKHGKEDPNNDPHVGGNTWAGIIIMERRPNSIMSSLMSDVWGCDRRYWWLRHGGYGRTGGALSPGQRSQSAPSV